MVVKSAYGNLIRAPDKRALVGKRDHALLRVLGDCGLRNAELRSLTARSIRLFVRGKGDVEREIPIPTATHAALETVGSPAMARADVAGGPPAKPATGFWRLARPAGAQRTWLFAPDGHAEFLLGINTVMRDSRVDGKARCAGIDRYVRRHDPTIAAHVEWARLSGGMSGGQRVARPYFFNSVGAFSEINDFDDTGGDSYMIRPPESGGAGAPYTVVLDVSPRGDDRALKDEQGTVLDSGFGGHSIGDPFNAAFLSDLDALVVRHVEPRRDDPRLQMWFAGNEIGIFDVAGKLPGVRDFRRWIWSDVPAGSSIDRPGCARHALAAFLRDIYDGSIADLNAAWDRAHSDFAAIVGAGPRPVPFVHDANARCAEDLQRFVHDRLLREWVRAVSTRIPPPTPTTSSPHRGWRSQIPGRTASGPDRHCPTPTTGSSRRSRPSATTPRWCATARWTCSPATGQPASTSSRSTSTADRRRSLARGSPTACTGWRASRACR